MSDLKWYDRKAIVIVLLIVFFPVGLFALWKGNCFGKLGKSVLTALLALLLIISFMGKEPSQSASTVSEQKVATTVSDETHPIKGEETAQSATHYKVDITAKEKGDELEIKISTTIPTPFLCALNVYAKHPRKDKFLIGVGHNLTINSPDTTLSIELVDMSRERLPSGTYTVWIEFNPVLAAQSDNPKLKDFSQTITDSVKIEMLNGDKTIEYIANRNDRRDKIRKKKKASKAWSKSVYASFCGSFSPVKTKGAPVRIAFYCKEADMCFLVNTRNNTIIATTHGKEPLDTW